MRRAMVLLMALVVLLGACDLPFLPEDPNAPCGFRWMTQQLPDDAQAAQETLAAAGIVAHEVMVSGFGEECVTSRGTVKGFGVLAETVNLTVEVADQAALGDLLG